MLSLIQKQKHSSSFEFFLSPEWKWGKRTQSAASLSMDDYRHTKYIYYCNLPHQVTNVQRMPPPPTHPDTTGAHTSSVYESAWMHLQKKPYYNQSRLVARPEWFFIEFWRWCSHTHPIARTHTHTHTHSLIFSSFSICQFMSNTSLDRQKLNGDHCKKILFF